ncbi:MAG: AI-2E family transporter [Lawsonibacter sp.]|nr:AI-2E family transporter [Lawsonibacter sp.]
MKREKYQNYIAAGITAFLVVAAGLLLFFAIFHLQDIRSFFGTISYILRPIFYGLVLAFLLLPVHRQIYRFLDGLFPAAKGKPRPNRKFLNLIAIVASLLFAALVIYLLLLMVITQVYPSLVGLVEAAPDYIRNLQAWLTDFFQNNPEVEESILPYYNSISISIQEWLQSDLMPNLESVNSTLNWIRTEILPSLTSVATNVSAAVMGFFLLMKDLLIAVIVSVYLLARKDQMAAQSKKIIYSLFPTKWGDLIVDETRNAYRILSGFINGKLLDSFIIGVICLVCCNIFKFPYPALVATVVGVTNIIPFFGPFIGAVPCALLILLVNPLQCVYFVIFILVLQQFDGNILGPKILGDSTGLDAFWVLFSILLFGGLFGFGGMVLGVPVFAMIYSIVSQLVRFGLHKRGLPEDTGNYLGQTGPLSKQ